VRSRRLALVFVALAVLLPACGSEDGSDSSAAREPAKSSASRSSATVWAVGDGADGSDNSRRVAKMIERAKPDRLLYLGDVYDEGTREEFERNYEPAYGRFDSIAAPTPGNHDWPKHDEGYDPYWKANGLVTNRHYYSFRAGGWEFLSLNSESGLEEGSPQRRWLKHRVRGRGTCRIAFWHRPYLNAGKHGDQEDTAPLWNAVRGRAALVISGHDHNFQHLKRHDGIVQLVSGAGGQELYPSNQHDRRLVWDEDDEYGALRLRLRPGVARFRFVAMSGRTLHSGSVRCRSK
jgi:hypothetical protein